MLAGLTVAFLLLKFMSKLNFYSLKLLWETHILSPFTRFWAFSKLALHAEHWISGFFWGHLVMTLCQNCHCQDIDFGQILCDFCLDFLENLDFEQKNLWDFTGNEEKNRILSKKKTLWNFTENEGKKQNFEQKNLWDFTENEGKNRIHTWKCQYLANSHF